MAAMSGLNLPERAIRQQTASAINIIVQITRLSDGSRKVVSISEITGMEGDLVSIQEIFVFKKRGIGETGAVLGEFSASGIRPRCSEHLAISGIQLPVSMFRPEIKY